MDSQDIFNFAKRAWDKLAYINGKTDFTIKFADNDIFLTHAEILKELRYFKTIISDTECEYLDFNIEGTKSFTKKIFTFLYERLVKKFSVTGYDCLLRLDNPVDQLDYIKMLDYLTDPLERYELTYGIEFSSMFWVGMVVNNIANVKTFFNDSALVAGFEKFLSRIKLDYCNLKHRKEILSIALYFGVLDTMYVSPYFPLVQRLVASVNEKSG